MVARILFGLYFGARPLGRGATIAVLGGRRAERADDAHIIDTLDTLESQLRRLHDELETQNAMLEEACALMEERLASVNAACARHHRSLRVIEGGRDA